MIPKDLMKLALWDWQPETPRLETAPDSVSKKWKFHWVSALREKRTRTCLLFVFRVAAKKFPSFLGIPRGSWKLKRKLPGKSGESVIAEASKT